MHRRKREVSDLYSEDVPLSIHRPPHAKQEEGNMQPGPNDQGPVRRSGGGRTAQQVAPGQHAAAAAAAVAQKGAADIPAATEARSRVKEDSDVSLAVSVQACCLGMLCVAAQHIDRYRAFDHARHNEGEHAPVLEIPVPSAAAVHPRQPVGVFVIRLEATNTQCWHV